MDYDEMLELIQPVLPDLDFIVRDSFDEYYLLHRKELTILSKRTRASEINDRISSRLNEVLSTIGHVEPVRFHGVTLFYLDNRCIIRVKKLDRSGKARYHHTNSSLLFDRNNDLLLLPQVPHIYFGYILNVHTGIPDMVVIAAPSAQEDMPADWIINISEEANKQIQFFRSEPVATPRLQPKLIPKKEFIK